MTTTLATLILFMITSYGTNIVYAQNTVNNIQAGTSPTKSPALSSGVTLTQIKTTPTPTPTTITTPTSPESTTQSTTKKTSTTVATTTTHKTTHSATSSIITTTANATNKLSHQEFSTENYTSSSTELPTSSNVTVDDLNTTDYTTEPTETSPSSISINNTSPTQTSSISSSAKTTTQIPTTVLQASTVASRTDGTSVQTKSKTAAITERHTTKHQSTSFVSETKIPVTNSKTKENSSTGSSAQTLSTDTTVAPTVATSAKNETYRPINGKDCRLGFTLKDKMCVYQCKDKVCQNDGVCTLVNDKAGNPPVPMCRCKIDDDVEYSGESCETSKPSRLKERKITLGILIPLTCIILLILTCTCLKLKRNGKAARALGNNYDLNSGAL